MENREECGALLDPRPSEMFRTIIVFVEKINLVLLSYLIYISLNMKNPRKFGMFLIET